MAAKSDKLHQRRKTAKDFERRKPSRAPESRILIVCEGEVTEVDYFEHLKAYARKTNVDIVICGKECGSSPIEVASFAIEKANAEGSHTAGGYDEVYCVFDKDDHSTFEKAKSRILQANKPRSKFAGGSIEAIWSIPSFEVWLLFHFRYSRSPIVASSGKTAAEVAASELRQHSNFEHFDKALDNQMLAKLRDNCTNAIANSQRALSDACNTAEPNPSTKMHELFLRLVDSPLND